MESSFFYEYTGFEVFNLGGFLNVKSALVDGKEVLVYKGIKRYRQSIIDKINKQLKTNYHH